MKSRKTSNTRNLLIQTRIVFHRAGAKRIHALVDRIVPSRHANEVANDVNLTYFRHALEIVVSEKLLRARAAGEFISYSEWESEQDIERYMKSDAHKEIVRQSRGLKGTKVVVKLYDLVK